MTTNNRHRSATEGAIVPSLLDYLGVIRRRKLVFLLVLNLVPITALALSATRPPTYEATSVVLLSSQNLGDAGQSGYFDAARVAKTRAELARIPAVVDRVLAAVPGAELDRIEFLESSSVTPELGSDFLTFAVKSPDQRLAMRLASQYGLAFTSYQRELESAELGAALGKVRRQLAQLDRSGATATSTYADLQEQERQLATLAALQTPSARVVREADRAPKVGPRTVRNTLIAFVLGLVLAVVVVFLLDALDTRVRSAETIREMLGLRILGRLPRPPSRLAKRDAPVMVAEPTGPDTQPFRILRANFESALAEANAQTVLVTSAVSGEGKSTTVANLAVALARVGRRVVVIDYDLRRPNLHRLLQVSEAPGLIDVALHEANPRDVVVDVPLPDAPSHVSGGNLQIVPAGHAVANPDELRVDTVVRSVIDSVRGHADVILVDAGPLLSAGDAISLASDVDAIVVITRLNTLRRAILEELSRNLENLPATKLGFIVADAGKDERHGQYRGYFAQPSQAAGPARLTVARSPSVGNGTDERAARSTP